MAYGKSMVGDIKQGRNVLYIEWFNELFKRKKKKIILDMDNWEGFASYLKSEFKINTNNGYNGVESVSDDYITVYFSSKSQYKYFYKLIMEYADSNYIEMKTANLNEMDLSIMLSEMISLANVMIELTNRNINQLEEKVKLHLQATETLCDEELLIQTEISSIKRVIDEIMKIDDKVSATLTKKEGDDHTSTSKDII